MAGLIVHRLSVYRLLFWFGFLWESLPSEFERILSPEICNLTEYLIYIFQPLERSL